MKKPKKQIIKIEPDLSFEEAMRHLANVKAEDVDETMRADEESEDAHIEEDTDYSEPPEAC